MGNITKRVEPLFRIEMIETCIGNPNFIETQKTRLYRENRTREIESRGICYIPSNGTVNEIAILIKRALRNGVRVETLRRAYP